MSGPLSLKTSTAKTSLPLLADGIMTKLRLQNIHWADAEGEKKWGTYRFEFVTVVAAASKDGPMINPGFPVFVNIMVGDMPDTPDWAKPEEAAKRIGRMLDGLLGTGEPNNPKGKPARPDFGPELVPTLIGKETVVKVKVKPNKNNPDQEFNEFSNFTYPPEVE